MLTKSSNTPDQSGVIKKLVLAVVLVLCVLAASVYSICTKRQFGFMGGMAEEYLELGINLHRTGAYQIPQGATQPFVFRPPGYVKFLELIFSYSGQLKPKNHVFTSLSEVEHEQRKIFNLVYVFQSFLLAASSLVLFLHLGQLISTIRAFFLALAFGINPYLIIYVGVPHYELLHIFFILVSTWLLHNAFTRQDGLAKQILWLMAGACWGLATLIRPVSLILPVMLAVAIGWHFRGNLKKGAAHWLFFVVAFTGVLMPWTWRNYQAVHRLIPVNAQASVAFWGSSIQRLELDANHYRWTDVWSPEGEKIYETITGEPQFRMSVYVDHNVLLEDEFAARFNSNVMSKPQVYLSNVCGNFILMTWGVNAVFVKIFQHLQHSGEGVNMEWFRPGNAQDFHPSTGSSACTILMLALTLAGYAGVACACVRKDPLITASFCAFATLVLAHAISYTDLMYYYTRVPFLFLFVAFFMRHSDCLPGRCSKIADRWLLPAVVICTSWLYWFVMVA
jgi:hypothetical protein